MPNDDLDVALFDWRGVKLTFRVPAETQDANGEIVSEIYFGENGEAVSPRLDKLIAYADIIADRLDAERAKGGLSAAAAEAGLPPAPVYSSNAPAIVAPPMGGTPTGYAPPQPVAEVCPQDGYPGVVKATPRGRVLECSNPQHKNDRGYPATIRWIDQNRR